MAVAPLPARVAKAHAEVVLAGPARGAAGLERETGAVAVSK